MAENNLFAIKKRVTAAKQTRKITSTMELIASSRLHRGKMLLSGLSGWAGHMQKAARCLPDRYFEHLAGLGGEAKNAYIVFGGSKGLSGSYGPDLFAYAAPIVSGHVVIAVGSAAEAVFTDPYCRFGDEAPSVAGAGAIAGVARALYESRAIHEAYVVYMRGTMQIAERLLPLSRTEPHIDRIILEPAGSALFPELFEAYLETIVYEAHLHAFIAEQLARVTAMDSATQNADEIIEGLQSRYNRIRQSNITQEIIMLSNAGKRGEYGYGE